MRRLLRPLLLLAIVLLPAAPAAASSASTLHIRGAGWGHGIGMSQYGAMGMARAGKSHEDILKHYYTGIELGTLPAGRSVRVLLQSTRSASFSGATRAGGRALQPGTTYVVSPRGAGQVDLKSASGRRLATLPAPLQVSGGTPMLRGPAANGVSNGRYRGALEFRPGSGGVTAVNAVSLEDYVQGVVPAESPASWPMEALKAQAVAARTYAITSSVRGAGFDQYADTRSQVYRGVGHEQATTNAATRATRGQVVTHGGRPVTTYFFSTSGGRTENIENAWPGSRPQPHLKSVADPYDRVSPRHRWQPTRMTTAQAGARLRGLVKGSFQNVRVVRRGASPRIVAADIVGSRGRTRVNGATLRARFGMFDSWAYFTVIHTRAERPQGGARAAARRLSVAGRVDPAPAGARLRVERRSGNRWAKTADTRLGRGGAYRVGVRQAGTYRVRYGSLTGPAVRVRR
jgi:stage II sporulation protein D